MQFEALKLTDLTKTETAALHAYKSASDGGPGNNFCFDMNDKLQSGVWPDELPTQIKKNVCALDAVFMRCPTLSQTCTMYRGTGYVSALGQLKKGRQFRALSFWSTSGEEQVAKLFIKSADLYPMGALLVLRLPKGLPVYNMETLSGAGGGEREFLLPRGILWQIENIEPMEEDKNSYLMSKNFQSLARVTLQAISPDTRPLA